MAIGNEIFGEKGMSEKQKKQLVGGIGLVGLGLLFLANQLFEVDNFGMMIFPAMAVIFTLWAAFTRTAGLFVPAGVFTGLSIGIGLMNSAVAERVAEDGGLFLVGFAAGWVFITVMTALFTRETYWWALIPAGIMGVIGVGVMTQGALLKMLGYINVIWPLVLIALGLYLVFRRPEEEKQPEEIIPDSKF